MKRSTSILAAVCLLLSGLLWASPSAAQVSGMAAQGGGETAQPDAAATEDVDKLLSGFSDTADEGEKEQVGPDLESGFQDSPEQGVPDTGDGGASEASAPSFFSLDGFIRLDSAYNYAHEAPLSDDPVQTDYRGLSKLRLALQLEANLDFGQGWKALISGQANRDFAYGINGRENYTEQVLDTYEQESELREVYLQGSPASALDIKIGRQIVVWGKSDNIRITDVLNPIDNREPGLVDIEDVRLPLTMSRLDFYFGDWGLSTIAIHEIRFNKDPAFGSDFFISDTPLPPEVVPEDGGANTEYAVSLNGIFSGFDLAFYWARIFDDDPRLFSTLGSNDLTTCVAPGACLLRHDRITMTGAAFNIALGGWLLKAEAAHFDGLRFFNLPDQEFARLDVLLGFEYVPIPDSTISLEAADRMILDYRDELELPPDNTPRNVNQWVFSYRADLLRQQLHVILVAIFFGTQADEGSVRRYSATYDLFEAFSIGGGVVTYHPGNPILDAARDNDRVFFDAKYSF